MCVSKKCKARTCPCKGCPQVQGCAKGCSYCDEVGHKRNIGFCSTTHRDGQLLYEQRKKQSQKTRVTPRCNTCGVPESDWEDGVCRACKRTHCDMTPDVIIEQRVYNWLLKHQLSGSMLYPCEVVQKVEKVLQEGNMTVPQYVQRYIEEVKTRHREP